MNKRFKALLHSWCLSFNRCINWQCY